MMHAISYWYCTQGSSGAAAALRYRQRRPAWWVRGRELQVYRKPVVGVLSTGDELVEPGEQHLGPGQIRDANRLMLASAASTSGCEVIDLGIARDTVEDVSAKLLASTPAPLCGLAFTLPRAALCDPSMCFDGVCNHALTKCMR